MACRLCQGHLFAHPLTTLPQAPRGAQAFTANPSHPGNAIALTVVQCAHCGLVQLDNDPVDYYRQAITAAGLSQEMRDFRIRQIGGWIKAHGLEGKRVLEIGAGQGLLLPLLKQIGLAAEGLEYRPAPAAMERAAAAGCALHDGYPDATLQLPQRYDAFVCFNFLEHAPDPVGFLRAIHGALADDACGFVEVPSLENMLETHLAYDWVADHLSYFTVETLTAALRLSGFDVLDIQRNWKNYSLAAEVRKRRPLAMTALNDALTQIVQDLQNWVRQRQAVGRRLAVWGASHQALTLLALAAVAPAVAYVIDSAAFKQGKFTPATSLPVVAPDHLAQAPVDDILVAAAGFSDEVVRLLRERHGFTGGIAVLRGNSIETVQ